jgi:hypothetical protein
MDEINEAINTYYRLKSQYEDNITDLKKKLDVPGLSWKEKRRQFAKLKPKCINCKRPVGTIFSNKVIDLDHHLIAMCGDKIKPCSLNIDINRGITINIRDFYIDDEAAIDILKKEVIVDKNNLLFGYTTSEEIVTKFDKIKDEVKKITDDSAYLLEQYTNITDNPLNRELLKKTQTELYSNINGIKLLIQEYDKTQNTQLVNDVIDLYNNELIPKLKIIAQNKYLYSNVEIEKDARYKTNTVYLIQKLYTIANLETNLGSPEIVSMKID